MRPEPAPQRRGAGPYGAGCGSLEIGAGDDEAVGSGRPEAGRAAGQRLAVSEEAMPPEVAGVCTRATLQGRGIWLRTATTAILPVEGEAAGGGWVLFGAVPSLG